MTTAQPTAEQSDQLAPLKAGMERAVRATAIERGADPAAVSDAQLLAAAMVHLTVLQLDRMGLIEKADEGAANIPDNSAKTLGDHVERGQQIIGCLPERLLASDEEIRDTAMGMACAAGELAGVVVHHAANPAPTAARDIGSLLASHLQHCLDASSQGEEA